MVKDNDASPALAEYREQDRFLPTANIARIMKRELFRCTAPLESRSAYCAGNLPRNAKISKEAKEIVQECVSEFICFVTSEASDKCQHDKRKTINGNDLLWSMDSLGFDKYVEPLKLYLAKYREVSRGFMLDPTPSTPTLACMYLRRKLRTSLSNSNREAKKRSKSLKKLTTMKMTLKIMTVRRKMMAALKRKTG